MTIEEIKLKISKLGVEYENTEAELEWVWEDLESEAEDLIVEYCQQQGYQIDNFSYVELEVDFIDQGKLWTVLKRFSLKYPDVADLMYHYNQSFCFEGFEDYMDMVRRNC